MRNLQYGHFGQISGRVYDAAVADTATKFLQSRIPFIGQRVCFDDGREYVYCRSGVNATIAAGTLVDQGIAESGNTAIDGSLTAAGAGATQVILDNTGDTMMGTAAAANTHPTKDLYAGGYLLIEDDAGEGYSYRIKGNTLADADIKTTLTLFDPLKVAVTTATDVQIVNNPYADVITHDASAPQVTVGCAVVAVTGVASTRQYFWAQTRGMGIVKVAASGGTITPGLPLVADDTTDGTVKLYVETELLQIVGHATTDGTSGAHVGICFQLP